MTGEEFLDKYGSVWVHYTYRWGYMYTYEGDLSEDSVIIVHCGGQPDKPNKGFVVDISKIECLNNVISAYVYQHGQLLEGYEPCTELL